MPFAHCIDCGSSALIDPSGRCPEGHEVGAAGARVAAAIGSTGPHPDEPKPWVGVVELDHTLIDAAAPEPRVARPPSLPATDQSAPVAAAPAATDDLLRELHALGDLADLGDTPAPVTPRPTPALAPTPVSPPVVTPAPAAPAAPAPVSAPVPIPPPAALAVTPGSPTPPSSPEEATELDELATLAAAIGSLDDRDALATPAPAPAHDAPPAPAAASALDELWAAAETAAPAVTPPAPTAVTPPTPTATSPLAPAPSASSPVAPLPTAAESVPASGAVATTEAPPAPETPAASAPLSPFDGSFTAKGDGVGRRTQRRLDAKATKKGLFRR